MFAGKLHDRTFLDISSTFFRPQEKIIDISEDKKDEPDKTG